MRRALNQRQTNSKDLIIIDKFVIWQLENIFPELLEGATTDDKFGIKKMCYIDQKMSDDYFLYEVLDKKKFIFAAIKYNIKFDNY